MKSQNRKNTQERNRSSKSRRKRQETKRIDDEVSFATAYVFSGVITAINAAGIGGVRRLAVNDSDGRRRLFTLEFTDDRPQLLKK